MSVLEVQAKNSFQIGTGHNDCCDKIRICFILLRVLRDTEVRKLELFDMTAKVYILTKSPSK